MIHILKLLLVPDHQDYKSTRVKFSYSTLVRPDSIVEYNMVTRKLNTLRAAAVLPGKLLLSHSPPVWLNCRAEHEQKRVAMLILLFFKKWLHRFQP
jgi:hypothetical protein